MRIEKFKNKVNSNLKKLKNMIPTILASTLLMQTKVLATGSISTAEVEQATDNIKNAIIKLAMPIRWNISIFKYCSYCIKNDSQFK